MNYEPIQTEFGYVSGRNAIYLDKVDFDYENQEVTFTGQFDAELCSSYDGSCEWIDYIISFKRVINFSMCELDHYSLNVLNETKSSIDRVINSGLISDLKKSDDSEKVRPEHQHFIVSTYDDIFDIVSTEIAVDVTESKQRNA